MIKNPLLLIVLIASVVACSHKPKPRDDQQKFVTHIDQSGSKQFQFSVQSRAANKNKSNGPRGGAKGGMGAKGQGKRGDGHAGNRRDEVRGSRNGDHENREKMRHKLYKKLEQHLANTEYCREGFVETDLYSDDGHIIIKGRCHDKARSEDRAKFRNQ